MGEWGRTDSTFPTWPEASLLVLWGLSSFSLDSEHLRREPGWLTWAVMLSLASIPCLKATDKNKMAVGGAESCPLITMTVVAVLCYRTMAQSSGKNAYHSSNTGADLYQWSQLV